MNIHDAHALQPLSFVSERRAHAANLAIHSLSEDDAEGLRIDAGDFGRLGQLAHDFHAAGHHAERQIGDRTIYRHHVLLFMIVLRTKNFVDDVAVVRQQYQPLRIPIQSPDRENPFRVPDVPDDVVFDVSFGGADDADRLVEGDVGLLFFDADQFAIDADFIALRYLRAQHGNLAVAGHAACFDPLVRLAPRTRSGFADVFIEPHGGIQGLPDKNVPI